MIGRKSWAIVFAVFTTFAASFSGRAFAADGGADASADADDGSASVDATVDDGSAEASAASGCINGEPATHGICGTTTPDNFGCSTGPTSSSSGNPLVFIAGAGLIALGLLRRRARRSAPVLALALAALSPALARADGPAATTPPPAPPLDQPRASAPPPTRRLTISYNPFGLQISRYGGNVELTLASHHVVEGNLYYLYSHTNSDSNNVFSGFGGEIGYHYFFGENGPRGFYAGPSFLLGFFNAKAAATGESTSFQNFGGALDVGYQAIVADRIVLGLGVGLQYTVPTVKFPQQEVPASVYANAGFRPRMLLAIGVAF